LADREGVICAAALPLKTAHKLKLKLNLKKSHSRDRRLPSSVGQERFRFAQQCVGDRCLQDTIDCRWLNRISGDAVIINPVGRIATVEASAFMRGRSASALREEFGPDLAL
jgi:hypothetical protein